MEKDNISPATGSEETLYGNFSTQEELDAEYNVERAVPNFSDYIQYYRNASAGVRASVTNRRSYDYGPTLMERLTVYPSAQPNSPVMIFVHGGYWRMGIGDDFDFIVNGPLELGFTVVNITYALAPQVAIPEITRQVRAAIAWTAKNIATLNGDANRIFVSGHSAGAHLAAMAASTRWQDYGLGSDTIKGLLCISGLYDLLPVSQTFIQPTLRITHEHIFSSSPARIIGPSDIPMTVSWGSMETAAFIKQSEDYLNSWRKEGNSGHELVIAGADHFSILKEFESGNGQLSQALKALSENGSLNGASAPLLSEWAP